MGKRDSMAEGVAVQGSDTPNDSSWRRQPLPSFLRNLHGSRKDEEAEPKRGLFSSQLRNLFFCLAIFLVSIAIVCAVVATKLLHHKPKPPHRHTTGLAPFREVIRANFPDPAIFKYNNTWHVFATNNAAGILDQPYNKTVDGYGKANVQYATSTDYLTWTLHNYTSDPLAKLGDWVAEGMFHMPVQSTSTGRHSKPINVTTAVPRANVWAPDLIRRPLDGKFVLYYSALSANSTKHCVGAAVSDNLTGPYEPLDEPLACPTHIGGAIDPAPFMDVDGTIYVAYKVDGNSKGHGGNCGNSVPPLADTPILLQRMNEDAVTPVGSPVTILDRTFHDGPLVEAPGIVRSDEGVYFLFFSSGCTRLPSYDLKYATSNNISGPYTRAQQPFLATGDWGLMAPGSVSVRQDGQKWRMAFHARIDTEFGRVRAMFTANITLNGTMLDWDRS